MAIGATGWGNLLAILTGLADGHRSEHILRYMPRSAWLSHTRPRIHPPIYPGESNWREYYRSRNLNCRINITMVASGQ